MAVNPDVSTVIVENDESETVAENLKLLDEIAAQISHKLDFRPSTRTAALKKMQPPRKRYQKMHAVTFYD